MKRIYSHSNIMFVGLLRSRLGNAGIESEIQNDTILGGAGELAPTDIWPELWIKHERDMLRAQAIVDEFESPISNTETWQCQACKEENDMTFEICWQCQEPKAES